MKLKMNVVKKNKKLETLMEILPLNQKKTKFF